MPQTLPPWRHGASRLPRLAPGSGPMAPQLSAPSISIVPVLRNDHWHANAKGHSVRPSVCHIVSHAYTVQDIEQCFAHMIERFHS